MKDALIHFKEFISSFETTGSICATSQWAATAMTEPLREQTGTKDILEIGPGLGSVTVQILRDMQPGDKLTIVEINETFLEKLKTKLADNADYQRHKENVNFVRAAVQELSDDNHYDIIVCSLPFLNFDIETIEGIFDKLRDVSKPHTVMTYYQYMGLRNLGRMVAPKNKKRDREIAESYFREIHSKQQIAKHRCWLNVLPINIYTLQMSHENSIVQ